MNKYVPPDDKATYPAHVIEAKRGKQYAVMFQYNRSFDLQLPTRMVHFPPNGCELLSEAEVASEAWKSAAQFFSITEVT